MTALQDTRSNVHGTQLTDARIHTRTVADPSPAGAEASYP